MANRGVVILNEARSDVAGEVKDLPPRSFVRLRRPQDDTGMRITYLVARLPS